MRLEQTSHDLRAGWPDAVAYREAIQSPSLSLADTTLAGASVAQTRQGLPLAYTGRFAIVFKLTAADNTAWALRCFTSPGDTFGLSRGTRYRLLATYLEKQPDLFVPYRVAEKGIRIAGKSYPTLAMRWAPGTPLGAWVDTHRNDPERLRRLIGALSETLNRLETAGIAHGDWQHDNLLITDDGGKVTLVDYDGMFVPELLGYPAPELGHPNYQHPARGERHYGPGLDRFACLVMRTALLALIKQPALWERHGDGESLLFKASDFRDPDRSSLFAELRAQAELDHDEELAESLALLADACRHEAAASLLPELTNTPPRPIPNLEPVDETVAAPVDGGWRQLLSQEEQVAHANWWEGMRPIRTVGMQAQQADRFRFLESLEEPAAKNEEAIRFMALRIVLGLLLLAGFAMMFQSGPLMLAIALIVGATFLAMGYAGWARRRVRTNLDAELSRMTQLVGERRDRIGHRNQSTTPAASQATRLSLQDYVAEKMRQIAINRLLSVPGINVSTLRLLRDEGIQTALDLSRRTAIGQVPAHQIQGLQNWCRSLEQDYADEYRRLTAAARNVQVDVSRLEMEIAEFQREVDKLERERKQFPDVDFAAFVQRLLGK